MMAGGRKYQGSLEKWPGKGLEVSIFSKYGSGSVAVFQSWAALILNSFLIIQTQRHI